MNTLSRRRFLATAATAAAGGRLVVRAAVTSPMWSGPQSHAAPLILSTWPFGKPANDKALSVLAAGGSGLDAIEQGINVTEADPNNPYVGLAGIPNSAGVVQLDACIMSGPGHRGGSVAGVAGYRHPISIARAVMERTKHVMLVGKGAEDFAGKHGFERGPKVSDKQRADW
ncbi:MAG TPA: isoaspartyl peptidase/L-asparaginase, partial [Gemmataceae bacterium]|nr:isoaspartyl peptidase/L-asparaginase [Gemmataceae bacterium]